MTVIVDEQPAIAGVGLGWVTCAFTLTSSALNGWKESNDGWRTSNELCQELNDELEAR